jgi:hypothetical protein
MKFREKVDAILKSLGGGTDEGEVKEDPGEEEEDPDLNPDGTGDGGNGKEGGEDLKKSRLLDATEIMTALVDELHTLNKSLDTTNKRQEGLEKSQADLGDAIVGIAEMVSKIGNAPNPIKTTLTKSMPAQGGGDAGDRLTRAEFEQAQRALARACAEKRITLFKSSMLESEMQKAMSIPGYQMSLEDRSLIAREIKTA